MDYLSVLKQYFGYDSFRGIQKDIVESVGAGRDTLGLMPTGGGKSITFQVPALAMDGVCIVVTPLIALMKDQVEHLRNRGILAAYVNSSLTVSRINQILDNAIFGGVKFLYISPERIGTALFQQKVRNMKVCLIAVDEAHCISQWGYDFRPSYLNISKIRELVPSAPIIALTATATPDVVEDIQRQLNFVNGNVRKMSFRRENLVYVTRSVNDKIRELIHILKSVNGSAIVYTRDRKGTSEIADILNSQGISATYYHAGLDYAVKDQRQLDWQNDEVRVMVATNAFGMGIDKPDVRLVIHVDVPDSIEAYFQEAGRGGRDGKKSYAVLLYDGGDAGRLRRHADSAFPDKDYLRLVYDHLAYYFQLAVDSGEGATYNFDIERFCHTFKHYPATLENALSILQRLGYIKYDPDPDNHPRVQFLLSREQLYQLRGISAGEERVINGLLRIYGGLFSDLVYIEEAFVANSLGCSEETIHTILKDLARCHIIRYIPRHDIPQISYPQNRIDSSRLRFPREQYEDLRDRLNNRVEAVIRYLEDSTVCRQVQLLSYFGEESTPCGRCDVCLAGKADASVTSDARHLIINLVSKYADGISPAEIYKLNVPRKELETAVRALVDEGRLHYDGILVKCS